MIMRPNQVIEVCSSTNDLARELGNAGHPHGSWISAHLQTGGRGRRGRHWGAMEGNLFFSIVIREVPKALWTWVPLTVAVGTVTFLAGEYPKLDFKIKWPNDIWISQAKCGGILCEAVSSGTFIVAGIGLNCAQSPGQVPGMLYPVTSLSESLGGAAVVVDRVREGIRLSVIDALAELASQGTEGVSAAYAARALYSPGVRVTWADTPHEGVVVGLGPSGELLVRQGTVMKSLLSEDVSIFNGKSEL